MNCLVIDCSTRWMICGLIAHEASRIGDGPSFQREAPRESSTRLVAEIHDLIRKAGTRPDWILCSLGPGSFTGIRIGVTSARDLAQLWDVPITGIDTLTLYGGSLLKGNASAENPGTRANFALMLDGRQKRYYTKPIRSIDLAAIASEPILDLSPSDYDRLVHLPVAYCDEPRTLSLPNVDIRPLDGKALSARSFLETALLLSTGTGATTMGGRWNDIVPIYVRTDPAHAKFPSGFDTATTRKPAEPALPPNKTNNGN